MQRAVVSVVLVMAVLLGMGACGDGEDRPGQVTEEGTGTGTGSGSGTGTGSASGTGSVSGTGASSFSEGEADTVVHATLKDFEIGGVPETVKGEKVYFEVKNDGPSKHEFYVIGADGKTVSEIEEIDAGKESSKGIALKPGDYTAECRIEAADNKTHADLGMKRAFKVE